MFPEALPPATTVLHEATLRRYLLAGWDKTKVYLDGFELSEQVLSDIALTLRRTTRLIHKRPGETAERDALFEHLIEYVRVRCEGSVDIVARAIDLLRLAEQGYRQILELFARSSAAFLPSESRIALALGDCAKECHEVSKALGARLADVTEVLGYNTPALDRIGDAAIIADDVNDALVSVTTSILIMAAISARWINDNGEVTFPALPSVSDIDQAVIDADQLLAASWSKWRLFEERMRYLGGDVVLGRYEDGDVLDLMLDESIYYADAYVHFAKERMSTRFFSEFQLCQDTGFVDVVDRVGAALPPASFVSLREAVSLTLLIELLAIDFRVDDEAYGGLRVVEWLRAYCVLQLLAQNAHEKGGEPGLLVVLQFEEVIEAFSAAGLSREASAKAVHHLTLKKDSTDLFDAPLLKFANGDYMLFGPGLISSSPLLVLLSIFQTNRYDFAGKGELFEDDVRAILSKHGLHARRVKEVFDGSEYECEAVLRWDDLLFAFECKNRLLPGNSPAQLYYFWRQVNEDIAQAKRFAEFLSRHKEIQERIVGLDAGDLTIVSCIVSSFPFWCPELDDVLFADATMLARLFSERYLFLTRTIEINGFKGMTRVALDDLWRGNAPTPSRLLRYLGDPPQIKSLLATSTVVKVAFPMGSFVAVLPFFAPKEPTMAEFLEPFPVSEETVRKEFRKLESVVKAAATGDKSKLSKEDFEDDSMSEDGEPRYRITLVQKRKPTESIPAVAELDAGSLPDIEAH